MNNYHRNSEQGFTLIELLIVMSLILILMTLAIPNLMKIHKQGNETSAIASLRAINNAEICLRHDLSRQPVRLLAHRARRHRSSRLRAFVCRTPG